MTPTAALALLAAIAVPGAQPLPADPFQRTAVQVLRGDFGKQPQWIIDGYSKALEGRGITCAGYAYLTSYGPWESPSISGGPFAADGARLNETMCAADRGLPFGVLVWADGSLRIVRDRGGAVTVSAAKRHHRRNSRNLDFYCRSTERHFRISTQYAVVPGNWRD
jgi:hypothetical protein